MIKLKSFLSILAVLFFTLGVVHAEEGRDRAGEFFEHLQKTFTKEGGSKEGLAAIEKSFNTAKAGLEAMEKEIKPLAEELEKIMSAATFDEKAFRATNEKINAIVIKSMSQKTDASVSLMKELNTKDRQILAKIFSKLPMMH
ncbi:MAG: hypothetical protein LBQ34_06840 [Alphaproteobacteria bacterium]|jgi:Skp family chaperone for outer membrane proteins|nr:hypothetical protein [Alphaproteobacteria bacterium]